MNYTVAPGLYSLGHPDEHSPVMVSANYKMSFDSLRKELAGIDAYLLVLDTKGVNVWCAASKGTFATEELVARIQEVELSKYVSHKDLLVPQLGATGVSAHEVQRKSGFRVTYGPIRAEDIRDFLDRKMEATPEMREVRFNFVDRLILTPIEIVASFKLSLLIFGVMFLLNLIGVTTFGGLDVIGFLGAVGVGCVLVPLFLPWIPCRAFSVKGWIAGLLWTLVFLAFSTGAPGSSFEVLIVASYLLILPAVASAYALNFTGCTTYTSLSGVAKEIKIAVPIIVISMAIGIALRLVSGFIA